MNATTLVLTFAALTAVAAAQTPAASASTELAAILAVEEQERDLAKAEAMYRSALAGTTLSTDARALANLRLAELLQRLGRVDDAKPFAAAAAAAGLVSDGKKRGAGAQDVERDKALRAKAHEVVKQVLGEGEQSDTSHSPIYGINKRLADQLLWLGVAAVPEVIAALEGLAVADTYGPLTVASLGAFLWRVGGAQATEFLRRASDVPRLAPYMAHAACSLRGPEMMPVAADYLRHANADLSLAMLADTRWGEPLVHRMDHALLVQVLGQGNVAQRVRLLELPRDVQLAPAVMPAFIAAIRAALASTEPQLGAAAHQVIGSQQIAGSILGTELLLEVLPQLPAGLQYMEVGESPEQKAHGRTWRGRFDTAAATRMLPKLDACIRAMGKVSDARDSKLVWLRSRIHEIGQALDASAVPLMLAWWDLGHELDSSLWYGKVTTENAAELFAQLPRVRPSARDNFLGCFHGVELPQSMFTALREQATALGSNWHPRLGMLMARTGNPEAAEWFRSAPPADQLAREWRYSALIELGRRNQGEAVRAAIRASIEAMPEGGHYFTAELLLALLSMGDVPALQLTITNLAKTGSAVHPYAPLPSGEAKSREAMIAPLAYLLEKEPSPPHGFSDEAVIPLLPALASIVNEGPEYAAMSSTRLRLVSDKVLIAGVVADLAGTWGQRNVPGSGMTWHREFARRLAREAVDGPLHRWFDEALRTRGPGFWVLLAFEGEQLVRIRPQLDAIIAGDDAESARQVVVHLQSQSQPLDLDALLRSKHESVRGFAFWQAMKQGTLPTDIAIAGLQTWRGHGDIAKYLGERLAVEAVPSLIGLLKHKEEYVRKSATDALGKIRFHHEQQAHWDRVLKGLDASPASAAEKLLLQAKPGSPKEQRLLAITSLGTLGVPEALPFLIEWTQDADATVQQAAKAAITQIHLHPRK
jgi:hypothetical protein